MDDCEFCESELTLHYAPCCDRFYCDVCDRDAEFGPKRCITCNLIIHNEICKSCYDDLKDFHHKGECVKCHPPKCQDMWGNMGHNCDELASHFIYCCEEWRCETCYKKANMSDRYCKKCNAVQYVNYCDRCYTCEEMSGEADWCNNCDLLKKKLKEMEIK